MAATLNYGYILPQNPDTGDTFWANLSTDIQLMANHVHDGVTGEVTPATLQTLSNTNWTATTDKPGTYQQTVTIPSNFDLGYTTPVFRLGNGNIFYPSIQFVSPGSFIIYINDPTQTVSVAYH